MRVIQMTKKQKHIALRENTLKAESYIYMYTGLLQTLDCQLAEPIFSLVNTCKMRCGNVSLHFCIS